ncbi:MAG: DinB family protein [Gemmatimonadota bacterium]|nr:DinB family protein [Gemmatimonadota bacterium]
MNTQQVLKRLDAARAELEESYAGLSDSQLLIPGVTGKWSVRDLIAHVTWWEEEALKHLPLIREGGRPPRYFVTYAGIDAFNALMTENRRHLSLTEVLGQHHEVHARLREYVRAAPEELFTRETRFRRRLRADSYGHYPIHAKAIREWRRRSIG